jgi:hypothetical protein
MPGLCRIIFDGNKIRLDDSGAATQKLNDAFMEQTSITRDVAWRTSVADLFFLPVPRSQLQ